MNYANGSELLPHFSSVMVAIATSVPITHMSVSKNSAPTGGERQLRKITSIDIKNHYFYGGPHYVRVYFYCDFFFLGGVEGQYG